MSFAITISIQSLSSEMTMFPFNVLPRNFIKTREPENLQVIVYLNVSGNSSLRMT